MLRTVKKLARHRRIALVDRMEIRIAELRRPVLVKAMVVFHLRSRDLRLADVLETVDHIRRIKPAHTSFRLGMKVHQIAREVGRHIVVDAVVERIDAVAVPAIPALALNAEIKVHGLLGLQVRIADPVVAEPRAIVIHGSACIHLPAVVQLAHPRLGVACAEVHLEALIRLAADVVRHTDIERRMRAEEIAVVDAQDW